MRLANRVLVSALAIFVLSAAASAQRLRQENDPRNLSPAVGTGGPEGGPTGLFTIYDGQTIRRGEYTFSVAYSNYDRDPGNVDIVEVPVSFNIGLNDHIELWVKSTGYRGVKVNSPTHLSSFYLPNSQLKFPALGSGPAIILAPNNLPAGCASIANTAVFRPSFSQPFVQYPFIGGRASSLNLATVGGPPPIQIGCASAPNPTMGFTVSPNSGTFGPADTFPGLGSPVGSILPGIVLATTTLPATALTSPITVPVTFTIAPSYLPDAPFVNRLYGESSFNNLVFGAKWRFTSPGNPLGVGIIPFWRWWMDKADDASGFNQMQRGSGPGGDIGDFGLIGFLDARLSRSVNVSVNGGYILNSNPKFANGEVILDRPDEFIAGIGFDFPINKHFQPILELRSTQYVGGRTPNALENSPVEGLAGAKFYPRRWFGFGLWYRMHFNQQDKSLFNGHDFNVPVQQITNVTVPVRGLVVVPGTTASATAGGFPRGFNFSDDANGFGVQFFAGHRNAREPDVLPNQAPVISSFAASTSTITMPCPPDTHSSSGSCPTTATTSVGLTTTATDPDGDTLLYTYSTTGGRITGDGANVTWDLSGLAPGTYTASVEVDDGCGCISFSSTTVTIATCSDCVPNLVCPTLAVTCTDSVDEGTPITFTANFTQGTPTVSETYNWTVSAGTITSGQGTSSITVDTKGLGGQSVTATVEVGGVDPTCNRTASCTTPVKPVRIATKFDEYGNIRFNDEKARLDNYAIALQNEPTAQGTIIAYGTCDEEGQKRAQRAKDYLVNTRGIDAGRIVVVDGGCMPELKVQLWIVPSGATAPAPETAGAVSPCPDCKKAPKGRRGRRGEE
ncbi:MAG TPA: hypothetical protein VGP81_06165 [Pyrinomonadaceae bacterium]|jgi:hypothetical protein|nr:hypothetical protein [Pyrinomonadaceae bacterium]